MGLHSALAEPVAPEQVVQPNCSFGCRSAGLTLVEMLVVLAIVVLIAAVSIGALILLPEHARVRATEALIGKIDAKLTQRLNEFNQRR